jgi:hypothetical protein
VAFGLNDPCEVALVEGASLREVLAIAASQASSEALRESAPERSEWDEETVRVRALVHSSSQKAASARVAR